MTLHSDVLTWCVFVGLLRQTDDLQSCAGTEVPTLWNYRMQYCVVSLTLKLPNDIYITHELSSSGVSGSCLGSRCTLCCNSFFVPRQCINFMSQQATTGSLCRAKQCLIGFRSMATPPEACFHLLFQQHLERNGGDYIPPVVSRRFSPHRPLGIRRWQSRSTLPCCPAAPFSCWQIVNRCCCCCCRGVVTQHCWDTQVQRESW